jgi:phasin family protein
MKEGSMSTTTTRARTNETIAAAAHTAVETQANAARAYERGVSDLKAGASAVTAGFEQTQTKVKENMEKVMRTAEELVSFGQGNLEAFVKSGQIWAAGVQDLSRQFAATAQAHLDETLSTFKALTAVKSVKEVVDLQSGLARSTVEKTLSETGRFTEASVRLAEQAAAPIAARVTLAVEKFGRAA